MKKIQVFLLCLLTLYSQLVMATPPPPPDPPAAPIFVRPGRGLTLQTGMRVYYLDQNLKACIKVIGKGDGIWYVDSNGIRRNVIFKSDTEVIAFTGDTDQGIFFKIKDPVNVLYDKELYLTNRHVLIENPRFSDWDADGNRFNVLDKPANLTSYESLYDEELIQNNKIWDFTNVIDPELNAPNPKLNLAQFKAANVNIPPPDPNANVNVPPPDPNANVNVPPPDANANVNVPPPDANANANVPPPDPNANVNVPPPDPNANVNVPPPPEDIYVRSGRGMILRKGMAVYSLNSEGGVEVRPLQEGDGIVYINKYGSKQYCLFSATTNDPIQINSNTDQIVFLERDPNGLPLKIHGKRVYTELMPESYVANPEFFEFQQDGSIVQSLSPTYELKGYHFNDINWITLTPEPNAVPVGPAPASIPQLTLQPNVPYVTINDQVLLRVGTRVYYRDVNGVLCQYEMKVGDGYWVLGADGKTYRNSRILSEDEPLTVFSRAENMGLLIQNPNYKLPSGKPYYHRFGKSEVLIEEPEFYEYVKGSPLKINKNPLPNTGVTTVLGKDASPLPETLMGSVITPPPPTSPLSILDPEKLYSSFEKGVGLKEGMKIWYTQSDGKLVSHTLRVGDGYWIGNPNTGYTDMYIIENMDLPILSESNEIGLLINNRVTSVSGKVIANHLIRIPKGSVLVEEPKFIHIGDGGQWSYVPNAPEGVFVFEGSDLNSQFNVVPRPDEHIYARISRGVMIQNGTRVYYRDAHGNVRVRTMEIGDGYWLRNSDGSSAVFKIQGRTHKVVPWQSDPNQKMGILFRKYGADGNVIAGEFERFSAEDALIEDPVFTIYEGDIWFKVNAPTKSMTTFIGKETDLDRFLSATATDPRVTLPAPSPPGGHFYAPPRKGLGIRPGMKIYYYDNKGYKKIRILTQDDGVFYMDRHGSTQIKLLKNFEMLAMESDQDGIALFNPHSALQWECMTSNKIMVMDPVFCEFDGSGNYIFVNYKPKTAKFYYSMQNAGKKWDFTGVIDPSPDPVPVAPVNVLLNTSPDPQAISPVNPPSNLPISMKLSNDRLYVKITEEGGVKLRVGTRLYYRDVNGNVTVHTLRVGDGYWMQDENGNLMEVMHTDPLKEISIPPSNQKQGFIFKDMDENMKISMGSVSYIQSDRFLVEDPGFFKVEDGNIVLLNKPTATQIAFLGKDANELDLIKIDEGERFQPHFPNTQPNSSSSRLPSRSASASASASSSSSSSSSDEMIGRRMEYVRNANGKFILDANGRPIPVPPDAGDFADPGMYEVRLNRWRLLYETTVNDPNATVSDILPKVKVRPTKFAPVQNKIAIRKGMRIFYKENGVLSVYTLQEGDGIMYPSAEPGKPNVTLLLSQNEKVIPISKGDILMIHHPTQPNGFHLLTEQGSRPMIENPLYYRWAADGKVILMKSKPNKVIVFSTSDFEQAYAYLSPLPSAAAPPPPPPPVNPPPAQNQAHLSPSSSSSQMEGVRVTNLNLDEEGNLVKVTKSKVVQTPLDQDIVKRMRAGEGRANLFSEKLSENELMLLEAKLKEYIPPPPEFEEGMTPFQYKQAVMQWKAQYGNEWIRLNKIEVFTPDPNGKYVDRNGGKWKLWKNHVPPEGSGAKVVAGERVRPFPNSAQYHSLDEYVEAFNKFVRQHPLAVERTPRSIRLMSMIPNPEHYATEEAYTVELQKWCDQMKGCYAEFIKQAPLINEIHTAPNPRLRAGRPDFMKNLFFRDMEGPGTRGFFMEEEVMTRMAAPRAIGMEVKVGADLLARGFAIFCYAFVAATVLTEVVGYVTLIGGFIPTFQDEAAMHVHNGSYATRDQFTLLTREQKAKLKRISENMKEHPQDWCAAPIKGGTKLQMWNRKNHDYQITLTR